MIGGPNLRYARVDSFHDAHTGRGNVGLCLHKFDLRYGSLVYVMVASIFGDAGDP